MQYRNIVQEEILLDCDQSHVGYSLRALFSPVFLKVLVRSFRSIATMRLSGTVMRYGASKIMGSRPWLFGVTWRHRSRDHSTRGRRLPVGGPLWPWIYLAPLWRYGRLKFFQKGSSRKGGRSLIVGRSSLGRSVWTERKLNSWIYTVTHK